MKKQHEDSPPPESAAGHAQATPEEMNPRALTSRRGFLGGLGGTAMAALAASTPPVSDSSFDLLEDPTRPDTRRAQARRIRSYQLRQQAAFNEFKRGIFPKRTNGDEERYPHRIGNYSKGLPHNELGEVDPSAYDAMLRALATGRFEDFEALPSAAGCN
ncbi:twin-arginine translocation signal domain-containing protein [Cystobacter fuscus]